MTVDRRSDAAAADDAAADRFVEAARRAHGAGRVFRAVLAGGSTPSTCYRRLAEEPRRSAVNWPRVELFFGDERLVPHRDPGSNYRMARAALLEHVPLPRAAVHRMPLPGPGEDADSAARAYESTIARSFRRALDDPPPRFDLVFLGLGADGHTASLFPRTAALDATRRWVLPNTAPTPPHARLTMTAPLLNAAAEVVFLVTGDGKAAAVRAILEGERDPRNLPAQLIRPADGELTWLLDAAAAAALTDTGST